MLGSRGDLADRPIVVVVPVWIYEMYSVVKWNLDAACGLRRLDSRIDAMEIYGIEKIGLCFSLGEGRININERNIQVGTHKDNKREQTTVLISDLFGYPRILSYLNLVRSRIPNANVTVTNIHQSYIQARYSLH